MQAALVAILVALRVHQTNFGGVRQPQSRAQLHGRGEHDRSCRVAQGKRGKHDVGYPPTVWPVNPEALQ